MKEQQLMECQVCMGCGSRAIPEGVGRITCDACGGDGLQEVPDDDVAAKADDQKKAERDAMLGLAISRLQDSGVIPKARDASECAHCLPVVSWGAPSCGHGFTALLGNEVAVALICTRPAGHEGDHVACGISEHEIGRVSR